MAAACSGAERPLGEGGQLDAEEGVGILDRLRDHAGDPLLEQRSARRPNRGRSRRLMNIANAPEWSPLPYASNTGAGRFQERLAEGQRDQRRLQQGERVHLLGVVEGQLGCDRRAGGVARDVSAPHTEMVEQRGGVGGVVRDAHRRRGVGAADPAALVVADQLVAVGQRRFCEAAARSSRR